MIQGVAKRRSERLAIRDEFIVIRCVSRYKFLVHAVITHKTPFIMVSAEPDLENILKSLVV